MALPRIKIQYLNGQLGIVGDSPDGLFALVCGATAVSQTLVLNTAYSLHSFDDFIKLGVTSENNPRLYKHVKEFYQEAEEGTKLILYPVDKTKGFSELCDKDNGQIKQLITSQNGVLRGIFVAGESRQATPKDGLDQDVFTALPKAQGLAEWATTSLFAPLFIILEGRGFKGIVPKSLRQETYNRVGILLGDTIVNSEGASIGVMAGKLAGLAVQRNIGRVKNGALKPLEMFLNAKTIDEQFGLVSDLYDAGYITPRKYVGKSGYFFVDDQLACRQEDDYSHLTARRTIDKAYRIAYNTLLDFMLDELTINEDGTLHQGIIASWSQFIENAINRSMTAEGELSANDKGEGCKVFIDPKQNVLATSKINISIKVRPYGYARFIDVALGFAVEQSNT